MRQPDIHPPPTGDPPARAPAADERPPIRAPWLTPAVIPALLVLQVAAVLIYVLAGQ